MKAGVQIDSGWPEMEFLYINLITILYSDFQTPYKKFRETRNTRVYS
jgi:hypothetical protein